VTRPRLDLLLAAAAVVCGIVCVLAPDTAWIRAPFAVVLLLVLPGVAAARALLPRCEDPALLVALTVGLSLATGVVGGVEIAAFGALSTVAWVSLAVGLTICGAMVALRRRPSRPAPRAGDDRPSARHSAARRIGTLSAAAAALVMIGVAVGLARTPLPVPDDRGYTVLSVSPAAGRENAVTVSASSHEARTRRFQLVTQVSGRPRERRTVSIAPGGRVDVVVGVPVAPAGEVTAALVEVGPPRRVYRRVRMALPLAGPAPVV
jgi:hypothetical protein